MVIQKKIGVKEKEAYARRLEVGLVNFDFPTHGGIVSGKNGPLAKFFIIGCLTNLLYHGTIVASGTGGSTLTNSSRPGGSKSRISQKQIILKWEEEKNISK